MVSLVFIEMLTWTRYCDKTFIFIIIIFYYFSPPDNGLQIVSITPSQIINTAKKDARDQGHCQNEVSCPGYLL